MAKVLLLTTTSSAARDFSHRDYERLVRFAKLDRLGSHMLVDDPVVADVILFVGSAERDHRDVRRHEWLRRYREKAFFYDAADRPIPLLPGVYVCGSRQWSPRRVRGGFYLRVAEHDAGEAPPAPDDAWLFSFVGNVHSARVRRDVVRLQHPRSFVQDTSAGGGSPESQRHFSEVLQRSLFVLAPRGFGTSTWRLFEAMKAGRVPVVISDDWLEPSGPDWNACAVRIRERDVPSLPALLERLEPQARAMGRRARQEWETWFSAEVAFQRIVDDCLAILRARRLPESICRFLAYRHFLEPFFFRHVLMARVRQSLHS